MEVLDPLPEGLDCFCSSIGEPHPFIGWNRTVTGMKPSRSRTEPFEIPDPGLAIERPTPADAGAVFSTRLHAAGGARAFWSRRPRLAFGLGVLVAPLVGTEVFAAALGPCWTGAGAAARQHPSGDSRVLFARMLGALIQILPVVVELQCPRSLALAAVVHARA